MNSFYTDDELAAFNFKKIGKNNKISRKASIYGEENVVIGNNVRIDDFCILSGKILIGNHVHIAAGSYLYGGYNGIYLDDFSNISSRVAVYAVTDDYSGLSMTNPMIPNDYKTIIDEKVIIQKHVIIGSGSTVLPGAILNEGVAIGAMSLVKGNIEEWTICAGVPLHKLKQRKKNVLKLEEEFMLNSNSF